MNNERTIKFKSKKLAVRIVNLYKYLCNDKKEFVLSKQILRSGTSIGANIAESECAISKKDFLNKVYIALKECSETIYWLDLLYDTDYLTEKEYLSMGIKTLSLFFIDEVAKYLRKTLLWRPYDQSCYAIYNRRKISA